MSRLLRPIAVAIAIAASASAATAQTFSGFDVGGGIGGTRTNSNAAHSAWLAAAGAVTFSQNFEGIALGSSTPINLGGGITLTSNGPVGGSFDLNQVTNNQSHDIGYNTTAGGSRFYRQSPDFSSTSTVRYSFGSAVSAFGLYVTGIQLGFGSATASWGAMSFLLPDTQGAPGRAGVQFFGFVSAAPISFIDFTAAANPGVRDIFGHDDIEIVGATVVPEPASMALMLAGLAGVGMAAARRRRV